jgi:hypothetical protein
VGFGDFHVLVESGWIEDGDFAQHLSIDDDGGRLEPEDEPAVVDAAFVACCAEPGDPKSSEVTLACTAISVGERPRADERVFNRSPLLAACAAETFGFLEDTSFLSIARCAKSCSGHGVAPKVLLLQTHQHFHAFGDGAFDEGGFSQLASAIAVFGTHQVASEGSLVLDFSAGGDFESLGDSLVCFLLWHRNYRLNCFWAKRRV